MHMRLPDNAKHFQFWADVLTPVLHLSCLSVESKNKQSAHKSIKKAQISRWLFKWKGILNLNLTFKIRLQYAKATSFGQSHYLSCFEDGRVCSSSHASVWKKMAKTTLHFYNPGRVYFNKYRQSKQLVSYFLLVTSFWSVIFCDIQQHPSAPNGTNVPQQCFCCFTAPP